MTAKATHCKVCNADRLKVDWPKKGALCLACYSVYIAKAVTQYRATTAGKAASVAASRKCYATPEGASRARKASQSWQKRFPARNCAKAVKRYTDKLQRTPKWFEVEAVKTFYENKPANS